MKIKTEMFHCLIYPVCMCVHTRVNHKLFILVFCSFFNKPIEMFYLPLLYLDNFLRKHLVWFPT